MTDIKEIPCPCCKDVLYQVGTGKGGPTIRSDRHGPHMICPHCSCRIIFKATQSQFGATWDFADTQTCVKTKA